jgi:hypothetical protein
MRVFATSVNRPELQRRAVLFGFARFEDFQQWSRSATSLASEIESLAPALAGDGPNPEYPWPSDLPMETPAEYDFELWNKLTATGQGRQFQVKVEIAVRKFPDYA